MKLFSQPLITLIIKRKSVEIQVEKLERETEKSIMLYLCFIFSQISLQIENN